MGTQTYSITIILLLFFIQNVSAELWFYDSEYLIIDMNISSHVKIIPSSQDYQIKYLIANISLYPKDNENQKLLKLNSIPKSWTYDNNIQFRWDSPREKELSYGINAEIKTVNNPIPIKDKADFPIRHLSEEIVEYTLPSKTIDSDDVEIIKLANNIADGEDDLFSVVYKIAVWTKSNIKYDLSTLTESVSQKASWVYRNRQGVCDEITTLFIALLRALGIPARFVIGLVYTESPQFPEHWGAHGWSEVFFPGYGWIPFDVTYGQYGYIDPTHIKFNTALDSKAPTSDYEWFGTNVIIKTEKLDINADIKETSRLKKPSFEISAVPLKESIGFGSYNLIITDVKNLANHYTTLELFIRTPREIQIIDSELKPVLLKPFETKRVFWIIKLSDNLNADYIYTLPHDIITSNNITTDIAFTGSVDGRIYSLDEIKNSMNELLEEEKKSYSRNVELNCAIDKNEFYYSESAIIKCNITNTGNVFLQNISICIINQECIEFDLGIGRGLNKSINLKNLTIGKYESEVIAKNKDIAKINKIRFSVKDIPKINIVNISFPENIEFNREFEVSFLLKKVSISEPKNVRVLASNNYDKNQWPLTNLSEDRGFIITLNSKDFSRKNNDFLINVTYEDSLGNEYHVDEDFVISLKGIKFYHRIVMFLKRLGNCFLLRC